MKVLLLGKSGMLGSCFLDFLSEHDVLAFGSELDICDQAALRVEFEKFGPELVLNCAAYTAVDDCEINSKQAFRVNSEGAANVARLCEEFTASLVHFSTDYVFSGEKDGGYLERDATEPINVYGESKLAGEKAVLAECSRHYIVRTSWLFGPGGNNFVDTMVRLGIERDNLRIVGDQIGSPTYTMDLCEAVMNKLIRAEFGIYHITSSGTTSWCDFAREIFEIRGISVKVEEIVSEQYPTPAKRPKNSVLLGSRMDFAMRDWHEALRVYLA